MLALSKQDLQQLVSMRDAVELMKTAFQELTEGRAQVPLRLGVDVDPGKAVTLLMPAYMPGLPALGFKVVSIFQENPKRGLDTAQAIVCMIDPETGVPQALLNGAYITALRTGAVSGASTDLMARRDAKHVSVIGAGVQGVTQAAAVAAVREIEKITVVYRSEESWSRYQEAIAEDWPELKDRLAGTQDAESAVRNADVVCLATTSTSPVFEDAWVQDGTHVTGVGSFTPEMQETPAEYIARARVVVDMKEHALEEAGDLIVPLRDGVITEDHIVGELGELAAGAFPGRESDDQVTFFKSVGNAVQDMAVGNVAVLRAREQGVGQQIDLG